jgi:hypothetical protein
MLTGYLRLIVFAIGLLVGVQVPGFVDQYVKRVSAHQIEAAKNFSGFQDTANRNFGGDVEALIAHHASSGDVTFKEEAQDIRDIYSRLTALTAEMTALRAPLMRQILHIVFNADPAILAETRAAYSYTVPLNPSAIVCGVGIGAILAFSAEILVLGIARLIRPRSRLGSVRRV